MALKQVDSTTEEEGTYWPPPQGEWTYEDYARSEVLPGFIVPVKDIFRY